MSAAASPFKLYPHQEDAVEAIVAALESDDRTQAIMACGTGKTFTGQRAAERITEDNPDALTLVTVPNMVLVDQLMREWIAQVSPGLEFRAQPVVSEATSEATRAAAAKRDEIVGFELRDNTTDPQRLAAFMLASGRRIIFSTYQSTDRIAEAVAIAKKTRPGFALDLIVADEAHRTAGPGTNAEAGLFKTILDDTKIAAAKRLFMTATPRQSQVSEGEEDNASFSMGNEGVYGKRATTLSLKWAVKHGHLAPYRAFVTQVSDSDVEELLRKDDRLRVTGSKSVIQAQASQVAAAIVLIKAAKQRNLGSIVTYHSSIKRAEDFKIILNHVVAVMPADSKPSGNLKVEHINGLTPAEDRAAYLATLDSTNRKPGDWSVVTNCNCLTEGVNVPSMDAIMLVDPRSSNVSIVQAVGRPMRKDKNRPEKVASILLPVFVGKFESVDAVIESGAFSSVNLALQALKKHDDALSEMFVNELAERDPISPRGPDNTDQRLVVVEPLPNEQGDPESSVDPTPSGSLPLIRITDHNGESLPGQPADAVVTIMAPESRGKAEPASIPRNLDWHNSLTLRVLKDNADSWERGLAAMSAYVARTGSSRIHASYISESNFPLGQWTGTCRQYHKAEILSPYRVAALEALPDWTWYPRQSRRDTVLTALRGYLSENGHARVPGNFVTADGIGLGKWVALKRIEYKDRALSAETIEELESMNGWAWDPLKSRRAATLAALRSYISEHGHSGVPQSFVTSEGIRLGKWVSLRRIKYRDGTLSAEMRAELTSVKGWTWGKEQAKKAPAPQKTPAPQYEKALAALASYASRYGHAVVPVNFAPGDEVPLGRWVTNRRRNLREGKLSTDQLAQIDAIDVSWRRGDLAPWESAPGVAKDEVRLSA